MKHRHKTFEIITQYFKNKPTKILSAKCGDCGEENYRLIELFQDRENKTFEAFGNKSPVVWMGQDATRYLKKYMTKEEINE